MRAADPNLPYLRTIAQALGELREPGLIAEPARAGLVMDRLRALSR